MPALRRNRLSEAPVDIAGTTGTAGHNWPAIFSIAPMTSGRIGEGGLGSGQFRRFSVTFSPAKYASVRSTAAASSFGSKRELIVALPRCGRAFAAWPPSIIVTTQVVRSCAFQPGRAVPSWPSG